MWIFPDKYTLLVGRTRRGGGAVHLSFVQSARLDSRSIGAGTVVRGRHAACWLRSPNEAACFFYLRDKYKLSGDSFAKI